MKEFSVITPKSGKAFKAGRVIEAEGTHAFSAGSTVWAVLRDVYGNYYLQNPTLDIKADGSWQAINIHLGTEIVEILFVKVNESGNTHFENKVMHKEWGAFGSFPAESVQVGRVQVRVK
jgi:hypothetical protein